MDDQELKRKFRGALLGVAVGDALGAPFEGMPSVSQILLVKRTAPASLQNEHSLWPTPRSAPRNFLFNS